jgi:hypothetical protein
LYHVSPRELIVAPTSELPDTLSPTNPIVSCRTI